jgi:hypothetical protein
MGRTFLRSVSAWFLVVVAACLAIPLSVEFWWSVRTVENESQYVNTLA